MRICDACREPIDNKVSYIVTIECFNDIGQYIQSQSKRVEFCKTCGERLKKSITEERED